MGLRTQNHTSWLRNRNHVSSIALLLPHTYVSRRGSTLHQGVALDTHHWPVEQPEMGVRIEQAAAFMAPAPADAAGLAFVTSTTPTHMMRHIPTCTP